MKATAPTTMFTYAKRGTIIRSRIISMERADATQVGHHRSVPRSVGTPVPSKRVKPAKAEEKPTTFKSAGVQGQRITEPENDPSLEPKSRL